MKISVDTYSIVCVAAGYAFGCVPVEGWWPRLQVCLMAMVCVLRIVPLLFELYGKPTK